MLAMIVALLVAAAIIFWPPPSDPSNPNSAYDQ